MQPPQPVLIRIIEFGGDDAADLRQVHLDALVRAGEPVLGHEALVDYRALQRDVST